EIAQMTAQSYQRNAAPQLLALAWQTSVRDLVATFEVEALRSDPQRRFEASTRREQVMKALFLEHYRRTADNQKVFARFGRNHLHRGYDRRGVSTLGNFIAEFAAARREKSFHVGAFAA